MAEELTEPEQEELSDLDAPLELLNSVSNRLLQGDIPASPARLQSLFEHIQSVIGDVVDASFAQITDALDQVEQANEALVESGDENDPAAQAYLKDFDAGREFIEESLSTMQETFFSAKSIDDLEQFEESFRQAEVQLAEGLSRLEQAVVRAEDPELFAEDQVETSPYVEAALDTFGLCLDSLAAHLGDGDPEHLESVLEKIELAREQVEAALVELDAEAELEDEAEFDEEANDDADFEADQEPDTDEES